MPENTVQYQLLTTMLQERFQVRRDLMTGQSTFQDLGLDSIAVVEVFVVLSEQLGVEVDDAQALPGTTLAQASELLSGVAPEVQ